MKTADVVRHYGSVIRLARVLGVTRGAVYQWGEAVPERHAWRLQVLTGGVLVVDPQMYQRKQNQTGRQRA